MAIAGVYLLCLFGILWGSQAVKTPPSSFANIWPGQPTASLGPDWQDYFEVKYPLPRLEHIALSRSFAGNLPVNRPNHPNNTLFFWAFEREGSNGTLTAPEDENNTNPWIIWLQGGPGDSGMLGLSQENGPALITNDRSWVANPFSWNTLADVIWIDQPVGAGYSTADAQGYIPDEDQMGEDFAGFLTNLVSVFPSLATRPLYLMGESYGGTFIARPLQSYIVKHIFSMSNPPVNLRKVVIGNGMLGSVTTVRELPVINILETYPAIIGYDEDVFNYFRAQHHLCGFDLNLTYPQTGGTFPTLSTTPGLRIALRDARRSRIDEPSHPSQHKSSLEELVARGFRTIVERSEQVNHREAKSSQWKRDLTSSGTLDPWYGCDIFDEMWDYAFNSTYPWKDSRVNFYDIPDATNPEPPQDAVPFFNNAVVRAALHAPTSKNWTSHFVYPFGSVYDRSIGNQRGDPSVEPMAFLTPLFANASARGIPFVFYSGNDDSSIPHHGTEVVIQNMTFGGIQGFTKKPSTPWFDDQGAFAGIVHQERNLTYVLFEGAGHAVPRWRPAQALVFLREFVLGNNPNGTVLGDGTVVGGENATLAKEYLLGGNEIFYGSATTAGTYTVPSATVAAWDQFIATATLGVASVTSQPNPSNSKPSSKKNGAAACNRLSDLVAMLAAMVGIVAFVSTQFAV